MLPVEVVLLQLVGHGPLLVLLQVHHHGQHLGNCRHNIGAKTAPNILRREFQEVVVCIIGVLMTYI